MTSVCTPWGSWAKLSDWPPISTFTPRTPSMPSSVLPMAVISDSSSCSFCTFLASMDRFTVAIPQAYSQESRRMSPVEKYICSPPVGLNSALTAASSRLSPSSARMDSVTVEKVAPSDMA